MVAIYSWTLARGRTIPSASLTSYLAWTNSGSSATPSTRTTMSITTQMQAWQSGCQQVRDLRFLSRRARLLLPISSMATIGIWSTSSLLSSLQPSLVPVLQLSSYSRLRLLDLASSTRLLVQTRSKPSPRKWSPWALRSSRNSSLLSKSAVDKLKQIALSDSIA